MTNSLSRDELIGQLCDSGLFSRADLHTALATFPAEADGDALVKQLLKAGKLTAYQAAAILDRKFDELVLGNYVVIDRLGAGGMGTVFKARHRRMNRVVALKVLSRAASQAESFLARFQREVEVIARLSHPNIVMAFDADEAAAGHFLVMEFVNGRDLATTVYDRGPLSVRDAVDAIIQSARALEYAHGQGIIHRDIKPANLLRDTTGVVKVADLGLARFNESLKGQNTALTQAGGVLGTVDYMSPEQAYDSTTIDHRSDIYSLGCTLYFLLTGRPPYTADTLMAALLKHSQAPIPSLTEARADVPTALDEVFRKMVAKKPEDRYATMTEVIRAMEGISLGPAAEVPPPLARRTEVLQRAETVVPPASSADTGMTVDLTAQRKPASPGVAVLLVEPSRTQAGIIRKLLQESGAERVEVLASGQKALEAMRAVRPKAVVSSMHLDDMTGAQLVGKVRAEAGLADVGFVLITSSPTDSSPDLHVLHGAPHTVLLPKPFDRDKLARALGEAEGPRFGTLRVLIVDDSAAARTHVRRTLEGMGFRLIKEAEDGTEAVALLSRETFDLVVTDYNMPLMDGRALVGFIRQKSACPAVPILMVTTETDPEKLEAARKLGVSEICEKSFPAEAVQPILARLLKR